MWWNIKYLQEKITVLDWLNKVFFASWVIWSKMMQWKDGFIRYDGKDWQIVLSDSFRGKYWLHKIIYAFFFRIFWIFSRDSLPQHLKTVENIQKLFGVKLRFSPPFLLLMEFQEFFNDEIANSNKIGLNGLLIFSFRNFILTSFMEHPNQMI